jgi:hypothetical protein
MKIKNLIQIAFILVFCTFSSCDLIDKATDVSFDTTVPMIFVVNETASNPSGKSFSDTKTIDVASDPEVAKYASKIKDFKVNKVTYTISGANPASVTFTNGTIKIASSGKTIASVSSASLSNTLETQLTTDASGINDLTASLLDNKQAQIQLQGTLSSTPVSFTLNIKFYLTVTANPL